MRPHGGHSVLIDRLKRTVLNLFYLALAPVLTALAWLIPKRRREYIWGPEPIINNRYWSEALCRAGFRSKTLMRTTFAINRRDDFDLLYDDVVPRWIQPSRLRRLLARVFALAYILRNASVVHIPFSGGPLGDTSIAPLEPHLYRWARIPVVVIPYGSDAYSYGSVMDPSIRHALIASYPEAAKRHAAVERQVRRWERHGDVVLTGFMVDGRARWDLATPAILSIDTDRWSSTAADLAAGRERQHGSPQSLVRVVHTPNHRGFKGTEFVVAAVEKLRREGMPVELVLLEGVANEQVRQELAQADILVEQLVYVGYAMSALEGMALGLPVLTNLSDDRYTQLFRRYSFLDECPILSTTIETLEENLRLLVTDAELRASLGAAGRDYVERYHSYATAAFMFDAVHRKIAGEDVDLLNLFHPLKGPLRSHSTLSAPYEGGDAETGDESPAGTAAT